MDRPGWIQFCKKVDELCKIYHKALPKMPSDMPPALLAAAAGLEAVCYLAKQYVQTHDRGYL